jgi:hypothetical protein
VSSNASSARESGSASARSKQARPRENQRGSEIVECVVAATAVNDIGGTPQLVRIRLAHHGVEQDCKIACLAPGQLSDFGLQHFALPIHVIARPIMGSLHKFPELRFIHGKILIYQVSDGATSPYQRL